MFKSKLAALILFSSMSFTAPALAADKWIEKTSVHNVNKTTENLIAAIKGAGATLFAVIDHHAGAKKVGLELPPTTVVIFGNPKLGTPIMKANPKAAIDLPIKVLIWNDGSAVRLGALSPDALAGRYDLTTVDPQLQKMNGALNKLLSKAAQ